MAPRIKQNMFLIAGIFLFGISLYLRIKYITWVSGDMRAYLFKWYDVIAQNGMFILAKQFSNYTPPYLYLLTLATFTSNFLSKVAGIKLISIIFDVYAAFIIFRIIHLRYRDGIMPYIAAAVYFSMPTIMVNSSVWGQADSIFTAFLLTCVYFLLVEMPFWAILSFSLAFAFKQQAIFFTPFLLVLTLHKKIPWYFYLIVPLVYIVSATPTVFLGRSWESVLKIYFSQASSGKALSRNAPNPYIFFSRSNYDVYIRPSLIAGQMIILAWVGFTQRRIKKFDSRLIILLALISVSLSPFVLPKMHDRYFYPADAISIVLGFWMPEMWFIPLFFQLTSGLSYARFLANQPLLYVKFAAIFNFFIIAFLLWKQFIWSNEMNNERPITNQRNTT